jgi:putative SOS response-associated peptidase YedK
MCGRYYFSGEGGDGKMKALIDAMEKKYPGAYKTGEIFPGDTAPAMIAVENRILPCPAVFGFPGFQSSQLLINARSETAAEKKTFSAALQSRRIILPATGFYEWSRDTQKVKYYFTVNERSTLYLCGIYQLVDGKYHFVIQTRSANASMVETHDRMPVIAAEREVRPYLTDFTAAKEIIANASPALTRQSA